MTRPTLTAFACLALVVASCGDDDTAGTTTEELDGQTSTPAEPASDGDGGTLTLVVYDSFPEEGTSLNDALDEFSADTGIDVELLIAGDTGTMVSKAVLTAGNPEGDVMWGVDNTFLSRALEAEVFEPYDTPAELPDELTSLSPDAAATPVDYGDVCVNYDIAYFADHDLEVPATLDDLTDPAYADLLVVENPGTSSPGLAFLLATIDEYGTDGWQAYWEALAQNGVEVVDGWTEAYYERFSWAGGGPRPLVVSYGTSPPAEVIFADPPREDAPTGVIESTCFRQVEFAGILRGTDDPEGARRLMDFLVSERFQSELALNLFVYPANDAVELPPEFVDFAVAPEAPRSLEPTAIDANRSAWIDEWTGIVIG